MSDDKYMFISACAYNKIYAKSTGLMITTKIGGCEKFQSLEKELEELRQFVVDYINGGEHDAGCIGAYEGRESQCRCNMRDAKEIMAKWSKP